MSKACHGANQVMSRKMALKIYQKMAYELHITDIALMI